MLYYTAMQTPHLASSPSSRDIYFNNAAVILCQAEHAGNVGAVCRAMDCMGFSKLVLVQCPEYDTDIVKMYALKSYWIYEQAERSPSLEHTLASYTYSAGFTRRTGARRQHPQIITTWAEKHFFRQSQLSQFARQSHIALVFGNEQHGLTSEELALCDESVYIPTSQSQPSLNLAQAVQLVVWECRRAVLVNVEPLDYELQEQSLNRTELMQRINNFLDLLEPLAIYKKHKKTDIATLLRSVFARADISKQELDRVLGFLEQIIQIKNKKT